MKKENKVCGDAKEREDRLGYIAEMIMTCGDYDGERVILCHDKSDRVRYRYYVSIDNTGTLSKHVEKASGDRCEELYGYSIGRLDIEATICEMTLNRERGGSRYPCGMTPAYDKDTIIRYIRHMVLCHGENPGISKYMRYPVSDDMQVNACNRRDDKRLTYDLREPVSRCVTTCDISRDTPYHKLFWIASLIEHSLLTRWIKNQMTRYGIEKHCVDGVTLDSPGYGFLISDKTLKCSDTGVVTAPLSVLRHGAEALESVTDSKRPVTLPEFAVSADNIGDVPHTESQVTEQQPQPKGVHVTIDIRTK